VTTDRAPAYPRVLDELMPTARHVSEQYAKQPHRRRSRPPEIPALADARSQAAPLSTSGQRRARVHTEPPPRPLRTRHPPRPSHGLPAAFSELALAIWSQPPLRLHLPALDQRNTARWDARLRAVGRSELVGCGDCLRAGRSTRPVGLHQRRV